MSVADLRPEMYNFNIVVKVVRELMHVVAQLDLDSSVCYSEYLVGDKSGCIHLKTSNIKTNVIQVGETIILRNVGTEVIDGHLRIFVGRFSTVASAHETNLISFVDDAANLSVLKYELIEAECQTI
eukprot:Colp12_sorted_trinity150504_noHs@11398